MPIGSIRDTLVEELNRKLPLTEARIPDLENKLTRCLECTHVYLNPRLNSPSLLRLYDLWYRFGYDGTQAALDGDEKRTREFEEKHLALFARAGLSPGRLLDVGTGTGLFVQVARRKGWDAVGLDWSSAAVEKAVELGREGIYHGDLTHHPFAGESFDAVTMFDYLEHTETPSADIKLAAALLRPSGLLAIRVPNYNCLQRRLTGLSWVGIFSLHLSYFTRRSLQRLLQENGLEVVIVNAGNHRSLSDFLAEKVRWLRFRLFNNDLATVPTRGATPPPLKTRARPIAFLWGIVLEFIDHIAGWFGKGQMLVMVGRKR